MVLFSIYINKVPTIIPKVETNITNNTTNNTTEIEINDTIEDIDPVENYWDGSDIEYEDW